MKLFRNMFNNDEAVSPIVATLVLIVVAIIGAAAVGLLMGTFSSDVSNQASTGDIGNTAGAEILVAGSTTIQPVSELLAKAYMGNNTGVKIDVQGGGSGAGMTSVGLDICDIGAASEDIPADVMAKYPSLKAYKIGGSGIVVIVNDGDVASYTPAELVTIFDELEAGTYTGTVYTRSDVSGTADQFAKFLGISSSKLQTTYDGATVDKVGVSGNQAMFDAVAGGDNRIGFVDFGFANGKTTVDMVSIDMGVSGIYTPTDAHIKAALKGDFTTTTGYPEKLARPLNYITSGEPSSIELDFINFARSPAAKYCFTQCGYFSILDIA